jgi:hypothetical protein
VIVRIASSAIGRHLALFTLLASTVACAPRAPLARPSFSFRPTHSGATSLRATPMAVEVVSERDARDLEAADPIYVGEIAVRGGLLHPSDVARMAADKGATHFRVVGASDDRRVDVILFRLERSL